jgi:hypothetical protein
MDLPITQQDTNQGVLRIALVALAMHMTEHLLPPPITIDLPNPTQPPYVRIRVAPMSAQQAWLDSVHFDGSDVEEVSPLGDRVVHHVRLPDSGTRIELVGLRMRDLETLQGVAS